MSVTSEHELALAVMDDDGFGCTITTTDEERQEAKARKLGGVPAGDRMVPMTELKELWAELEACGELWNGMTGHYLAERYGDRLYHVMGGGWFVRPAPSLPDALNEYLAAKHAYENLVSEWAHDPGDPVPAVIKSAEARVDALKEAAGYAGPDGPICCRRYGFLHEPLISEPGCWQAEHNECPRMTERRKADRAIMAAQVAELARGYGLDARVVSGEHLRPRAMFVNLEGPHGLKLTVQFSGDSPHREPDTYVLCWHGLETGWRLDPDRFGSVNPYHGHKATDVARGFGSLIGLLAMRFARIRDGRAFISPDPVPGTPEWNAGVPTKRELAAGVDDDSVSLTEYLNRLRTS